MFRSLEMIHLCLVLLICHLLSLHTGQYITCIYVFILIALTGACLQMYTARLAEVCCSIPLSPLTVFVSFCLSPSSLPKQDARGDPGRAGEGEETAFEHSWSEVGIVSSHGGSVHFMEAFHIHSISILHFIYLFPPSHSVAFRYPDRV